MQLYGEEKPLHMLWKQRNCQVLSVHYFLSNLYAVWTLHNGRQNNKILGKLTKNVFKYR